MAVNLSGMCHHRPWSNTSTRRLGQGRWRDWDHHSQRRLKEVTARDAVQRIPDLNTIYDLLKLKNVPNVGVGVGTDGLEALDNVLSLCSNYFLFSMLESGDG